MQPIYGGELIPESLTDPNNTHAILLHLVGYNHAVLEVGCATGYMTRVMVERQGCTVTGFDINSEAASLAKPYLQHLVVGNLDNDADLDRIEGQFDVILMGDVLEHLAWPAKPLHALRSRLRPNGHLIVSIPNVAHWSVRRALLFGHWDLTDRGLMDRTHLRWFTRRTATELLESVGYRVRQRRVSYAFPAHWRLGLGPHLAAWAQRRTMPGTFDDLFVIQHIFVAICA